jgi:hypothetical protein
VSKSWIVQAGTEPFQADVTLTDVGMAVHSTPQLSLRVVQVDAFDVFQPDHIVEVPHGLFVGLPAPDFVPCGKDMARVDAHPDPFPLRHPLSDRRQMLKAVA